MQELRNSLFDLALQWRESFPQVQVCALTGSCGKTSTKEILRELLGTYGKTVASVENHNTKPALAGDVFKFNEKTIFGVFEVGLRKPLDLQIPLRYLKPQVVACLNVGSAHREFFKNTDELVREKCRIFTESSETHTVIIPDDDPRIEEYARQSGRRILRFGFSAASDVRISTCGVNPALWRTELRLSVQGQELRLNVPGVHQALARNVAAAVGFLHALNLDLIKLPEFWENLGGAPGRFQLFRSGTRTFLDDSFNASPESMKAGLETLRQVFPGGRRLFVLGSMLELGTDSSRAHQDLSEFLRGIVKPEDSVFLVGPEWSGVLASELPKWHVFRDRQELEETPDSHREAAVADVIFLKGSKLHELSRLRSLWG